jgi:hypothetical protein
LPAIRLSESFPHIPQNVLLLHCDEVFDQNPVVPGVGGFRKDTPILLLLLQSFGQETTSQARRSR